MRSLFSICIILVTTSVVVSVDTAEAQPLPVDDAVYNDYARVMQVAGTSKRMVSFSALPVNNFCFAGEEKHPWVARLECDTNSEERLLRYGLVSPKADMYLNSERPFGQNDGVVWQGSGPTMSLSAGAWGKIAFLSAMFRPRIIYTRNADFDLSRLPLALHQSVYAYPYRNSIDWPQRFGDESWTDLVLDGSFVQVEFRSAAAGMSKQNLWWGPSLRNSLVMSNNAGGFWHAFLRTNDRIETPIGSFEGRWIWGHPSHSEYFVDASYSPTREVRKSEESRRFMTAITLNYSPQWIPGLYLGAAQSLMVHPGVREEFVRDYLGVVNIPFLSAEKPRPRGVDDKILSLFGRWVHPDSGVEIYGEWGRGDHTSDFRDFLVEPDHARAWTLGLHKIFKPSSRVWTRVLGEITNLEKTRESGHRVDRGSYFYTHQGVRQGYTHNGQVMGAAIGPGSNSQYFQFDVFAPFGRAGLHLLRWVHDNDSYFIYHLADQEFGWDYEVELGGGLSGLVFWKEFELEGSVTYTEVLNKDHVFENDVPNWNVHISIRRQVMGLR